MHAKSAAATPSPPARERMPSQIKYIVGNEAAERFSYYGMAAILFPYLLTMMGKPDAKGVYHLFIACAYFAPLIGAYLSDRYLGKYKTIIWLSLVYCAGHVVLSATEGSTTGLYVGLGLIALGAGGIKPCVSAHVGDQFTQSNKHLVNRAFNYFYWSINLGSFFSILLIPWMRVKWGYSFAFAVPGALMFLATFVFWLGRHHFVTVPPTGKNPHSFLKVVIDRIRGKAKERHSEEDIEATRAVFRVVLLFATLPLFWTLFHQHGSTWTAQAGEMDLNLFGWVLAYDQVQMINPLLVMAFVPLFIFVLYPWLQRRGVRISPLRKIGVGLFITASSFVAVAVVQRMIDQNHVRTGNSVEFTPVHVAWQLLPYFIITVGEILVSITALEFAYTQAPRSMKSVIMSLWMVTIATGNLISMFVLKKAPWDMATTFFIFAAAMAAISFVFVLVASFYKEREYIEKDRSSAESPGGHGKIPVEDRTAEAQGAQAIPVLPAAKTEARRRPEDLT